ncbi:MAG: regulatory iron-sulfur-containing complex subunit RicT [Thermodesulfobacteriota bacterium]|nr:regulatory iron-sulfur-containing complex subunit RicT [Thermodesulfobacteriota bacterium]
MKEENIEMVSDQEQNNEPDVPTSDIKGPNSGNGVKDETSIVLIAVRFRPKWPPSHYNAGNIPVMDAEWVVVPTEHGVEVGQVLGRPVVIKMPMKALPPKVERLASTHEIELYYRNLDREKVARDVCAERVRALGLSMKLVRVESFFDGSKVIFYYSAEGRVDFRELVKDLVKTLRTRVEMRQIGIRHETKMIGGVGICGREFCCASFLQGFDPVSIKMAKTQNLPLNPNKISGICGRLLCCLTYEHGIYLELAKGMPLPGKFCDTPAGQGKVVRQDILSRTVTVVLSDNTQQEFKISELEQHRLQQKKKPKSSTTHSPKQKRSGSKPGTEQKRREHLTASKDNANRPKDRTKEKNLKAKEKNRRNKGRRSQSKAKKNK